MKNKTKHQIAKKVEEREKKLWKDLSLAGSKNEHITQWILDVLVALPTKVGDAIVKDTIFFIAKEEVDGNMLNIREAYPNKNYLIILRLKEYGTETYALFVIAHEITHAWFEMNHMKHYGADDLLEKKADEQAKKWGFPEEKPEILAKHLMAYKLQQYTEALCAYILNGKPK